MIRHRFARSVVVGAASGLLVGALIAVVEVALVTLTARTGVFRPELLVYGGIIYAGFGFGLGSVVGLVWGALAARRARILQLSTHGLSDVGLHESTKTSRRPAATATRRAALGVGIGVAAVAVLGSIARALSSGGRDNPGTVGPPVESTPPAGAASVSTSATETPAAPVVAAVNSGQS